MRPSPTDSKRTLYERLRASRGLQAAWQQVRSNALRSSSPKIVSEAQAFDAEAARRLARIQKQLLQKKFRFEPAQGILIKKPGKRSPRPVVIAPIESRIVQRALLDVIQSIPEIDAALKSGFNFGGVSGRGFGVPAAVARAVEAAGRNGYFVRTDIRSFFTQVPRAQAVAKVLAHVDDTDFGSTFVKATETELADIQSYRDDELALFPIAEEGVAQGSCLSPMLCNLLLVDFDSAMNSRGVECIRYIDDFIVFAKNRQTAVKAFNGALDKLRMLGLSAYDPFSGDLGQQAKAEHGQPNEGITFLGCELTAHSVRPSKNNRRDLLAKVDLSLDAAIRKIRREFHSENLASDPANESFASALVLVGNTVRAWGNTFQFCSDDRLMRDLDIDIDKRVARYYVEFFKLVNKPGTPASKLRDALGVFRLGVCKRDDSDGSARTLARRAAARK